MTRTRCLMFAVALFTLSACGDSASSIANQIQEQDKQQESQSSQSSAPESADADPVEENLAAARQMDSFDEQQTSDGATVIVWVDCGIEGAHVIGASAAGLTVGDLYDGRGTPAFGGAITLQTLPDGRGVAARQSGSLDNAPSFVVDFPDLDGGMSFEVDGC